MATDTLVLPSHTLQLRPYIDLDFGAGMINEPTANTLTVVVSVLHPVFMLREHIHAAVRVHGLAIICRSRRVSALHVLEGDTVGVLEVLGGVVG